MSETHGARSAPDLERIGDEAERLSQLAVQSLPSGVLVVGPDGTIAIVNRHLEKQFGYAEHELIGQPVDVLLPDALHDAHATHRLGYMTRPETRTTDAGRQLYGRRKDGSQIPVEIGLNPIQLEAGVFVLASVVDITERRRLDEEHGQALEEGVQFDRLVGELAAGFVNLPAEQIDEAIKNALRRIVEGLDLDRAAVFQFSEPSDLVLTHHWARPGLTPAPPHASAASQFPWTMAKILGGEMASFSSLDEVPDTAERESIRQYGTKSRVALPLSIDGRVAGAIAFSISREERSWSSAIIGRLRLVAEVFGGALSRRQADLALRTSELRFRTLAEKAPAMIWVSGPDQLRTWFNRQWLEFVGHTMDHELGFGWAANVHPDDRDECLHVYASNFDARRPFSNEYRLGRHDGEWRWVLVHATPNFSADGTFIGYLGVCIDVTEQRKATQEVERSRDQLQAENLYLRLEVKDRLSTDVIIGQSPAIRHVLAQIEQVAGTDSTVLLLGETGTGKELFATRIHELSGRRARPMVRVNCAAIPATLIESELFGREKGAFTGALARQVGRFELADHSTIFLDEIGDLPGDVQVKLLRVLEERHIERLGSPKSIRVDVRIIAATHRNLEKRIAEGMFREDLFYRLNVFPIEVPPLRERVEDISLLVWRFVEEFSRTFGKRIDAISRENMAALQQYPWPGNIRELRNVVERAMIVATSSRLTIEMPTPRVVPGKRSAKLADVEKEHIRGVLESVRWRIRGPGGAADRLGLAPTTLETRMAKLGLARPKP
jgi:PAS domain S-box-containing protein